MRKPTLPSRPRSGEIIQGFTPTWINKLLDCIAYAMSHPLADGSTTRLTDAGVMQAIQRPQQSIIPAENNPGAEIFWVSPGDGLSSTYSTDERRVYSAYLFEGPAGSWDGTVLSCYFWVPNHITENVISWPAPAPLIACVKTTLVIDAGPPPVTLDVYVAIDYSWVIR